jgi:hypothetical protein
MLKSFIINDQTFPNDSEISYNLILIDERNKNPPQEVQMILIKANLINFEV